MDEVFGETDMLLADSFTKRKVREAIHGLMY